MANIADHLFFQAGRRPDHVALWFEGDAISFAQLAMQVRRAAGGLATAGVGAGTRVGLMVTARPEFIVYQQALFALGAIVMPLNIFYKPGELLHTIQSCELEAIVIEPIFFDRLPAVDESRARTLRVLISTEEVTPASDRRILSGAALIAASAPITTPTSLPGGAIAMMLNTSATTGKAKGVMLSIDNIAANYDRTPGWLGLDQDSVTCCALPLYNTFGLNQCVNALMVTGGTMVLLPRFEAGACIDSIERHRCTFFPGVPTMLQKILDHPDAGRRDLSSVRRIMTGAAPVPAPLLERIYRVMNQDAVIMTGYGLTEATAHVTLDRIELDEAGRIRRPKSIGKPLPTVEVRIVAEDGHVTAEGEPGEICIRGPLVMQGYYKMTEVTAEAVVDGWLHTGDIGLRDREGFLYIIDRKKDLIIRGGQNIYPADIEEVLYGISGVCEAAVIGVPDEVLGEVPHAYVAFGPGEQVPIVEIASRCEAELARYKVPCAYHILSELPKGPTGKILRRALRSETGQIVVQPPG